jgi:hypothetical protein
MGKDLNIVFEEPSISSSRWFELLYMSNTVDKILHNEFKSFDMNLGDWGRSSEVKPNESGHVLQRVNVYSSPVNDMSDILKAVLQCHSTTAKETERTWMSTNSEVMVRSTTELSGIPMTSPSDFNIWMQWRIQDHKKGVRVEITGHFAYVGSSFFIPAASVEDQLYTESKARVERYNQLCIDHVRKNRVKSGLVLVMYLFSSPSLFIRIIFDDYFLKNFLDPLL